MAQRTDTAIYGAMRAGAVASGVTSAGWCPDCDLPSVVVDSRDGMNAWAECTECGVGWTHRDEVAERPDPVVRTVRRAA
ncbi:MAG: hypothetical protein INR72_14865 [Williamsia herbipolensis]|nr:hypothetical protein [Williamsia herbipolensis]